MEPGAGGQARAILAVGGSVSALLQPRPSSRAMTLDDLGEVMAVEARCYSFPWTRGNFIDSLAAGYLARVRVDETGALMGYYVAMPGVGEMHLLNITVAPPWQGRGMAGAMLDELDAASRAAGCGEVWLEVRASNHRARAIYLHRGFVEVGLRRGYYPAAHGQREDAIVMRAALVAGGRDAVE